MDNYWSLGLRARERIVEEFPGVDPVPNDIVLFLNRASGILVDKLDQEVHRPSGLGWSGYKFLFSLWIMGDLQPYRIAELTHSSRALVSSLTASFLAAGYIDKRASQVDGRAVHLSLTESGQVRVRAAFEAQNRLQTSLLESLTSTEQEILRMLLAKMMLPHVPADGAGK